MEWQNYQEGETSGIFGGSDQPPIRHPVYKELAVINCSIKMMRRSVLVETLKCFDLSVAGNYTVLSKRLRHYYKRKKLTEAGIPLKVEILPYYVIVDFEATCEEVNTPNYPHEIIEFPAVLVSTERKEIISHFQAFCRPTINPILSDFCTELTGISQEQVDSADEFPTVLKNFEAWLKENLGTTHNYAIVTDGPWDMGRFLYGQCKISEIEYPHFAHKWVNIRKIFHNFYDTKQAKPGEVTEAVKYAIDAGYRHIDCAHVYGNESEIGVAIKAKIDEGAVKREELFITSKLWCTFHSEGKVIPACKTTLKNLGLDYLDLYLIHWPLGYKEGGDLFPKDANDKTQYSDVDYVETWKGMEACVSEGLTKSIGLSNFNSKQIDRVLAAAKIQPAVNQIECHPYLNQAKLLEFCKAKNIAITAYSPLGSPDRPWAQPSDPKLLEDPKLVELAKKYKKSTAQILLRYQVQRGNITIPKSANKHRIEENINIFDFVLAPEDMTYIDTFDCNGRVCHMTWCNDHKYWPFGVEF